jgi:hypothetical protein
VTREQAQIILMKAFVATGELPNDIQSLLILLIRASEPRDAA